MDIVNVVAIIAGLWVIIIGNRSLADIFFNFQKKVRLLDQQAGQRNQQKKDNMEPQKVGISTTEHDEDKLNQPETTQPLNLWQGIAFLVVEAIKHPGLVFILLTSFIVRVFPLLSLLLFICGLGIWLLGTGISIEIIKSIGSGLIGSAGIILACTLSAFITYLFGGLLLVVTGEMDEHDGFPPI